MKIKNKHGIEFDVYCRFKRINGGFIMETGYLKHIYGSIYLEDTPLRQTITTTNDKKSLIKLSKTEIQRILEPESRI